MEYSDGIDGEEAFATVALLLLLAVYCVEAAVSTCGPCCCVSAGASLLPLAALQAAEPQPIMPSQPAPILKQVINLRAAAGAVYSLYGAYSFAPHRKKREAWTV